MQVEMSLAELLINAIAADRVPGIRFQRGWPAAREKETFDGLRAVIADRLDGARRVAVQDALHQLQDQHPHFRTRARVRALEEAIRALLHSHNGTHAEDCPAYGADDADVVEEPGADPCCACGATKARTAARSVLQSGTAEKDGTG